MVPCQPFFLLLLVNSYHAESDIRVFARSVASVVGIFAAASIARRIPAATFNKIQTCFVLGRSPFPAIAPEVNAATIALRVGIGIITTTYITREGNEDVILARFKRSSIRRIECNNALVVIFCQRITIHAFYLYMVDACHLEVEADATDPTRKLGHPLPMPSR